MFAKSILGSLAAFGFSLGRMEPFTTGEWSELLPETTRLLQSAECVL